MLISEDDQPPRAGPSHAAEVARQAVEEGMITLRQDGLRKVTLGLISLEELARVTA